MMAEVDEELKKRLDELSRAEGAADQMRPRTKACIYQRASNEPAFDLPRELYRIALAWISPTYRVSAPIPRRPSSRKSDPMSLDFGMLRPLLPGWGSPRRSKSVAARGYGPKRGK